jgi:hypothetical protein
LVEIGVDLVWPVAGVDLEPTEEIFK